MTASGPAAVAVGGNAGPISTTHIGTQVVLGASSMPLAAAIRDPRRVYSIVGVDAFTGREWLAAKVDRFLAGNPCGYVFVEADAGVGKTAFAAWLVKTRGWLSHFSRPDGRSTRVALQNLSAQLIRKFAFDDLATGSMLPEWAQDPGGFEYLLRMAAKRLGEDSSGLVLVVDGLDEADPGGHELPFGLPLHLPDGVFVVGTYRTGNAPPRPQAPTLTVRIGKNDPRNEADIREFLIAAANRRELASRLGEVGLEPAAFASLLAERCDGVWVYLRYVLEEIRIGLRAPNALGDLPAELWEYYADQIRSWQHDPAWDQALFPLLATLGVAGEPMTAALLARLAGGLDASRVHRWCNLTIRPLLATRRTSADRPLEYEIYHLSFNEVLAGGLPERADDESPDRAMTLADEMRQATVTARGRIADIYLTAFGNLDAGLPVLAEHPGAAEADGGYPLRHLARHLEHAQRGSDLHRLLALEHSTATDRAVNTWHAAHEHANSVVNYLDDLRAARAICVDATNHELTCRQHAPTWAQEIRYVLMAASVASRTKHVSPTLLEHAVRAGLWSPGRGLDHARRLGRSDALIAIYPYLTPSEQPGVLGEALAAATAIMRDEGRAEALAELAPHLPADLLAQALAAATTIGDRYQRAKAVAALARRLPAGQQYHVLSKELAAMAALTDDVSRHNTLLALAPDLPPGLAPQALAAASTITGDLRDWALALLVPCVPADLLADALTAATAITGHRHHPEARALAALAPRLPPDLLARALAAATAIPSEDYRAAALAALAPELSPGQLTQALAAATAITGEYARAQAVSGLAPHLPPALLAQALDAATAITNGHYRDQALTGLAAHPPPGRLAELLAAVTAITNTRYQAQALSGLAPYLPPALLARALTAATAITDSGNRAEALSGLAAHLPAHEQPGVFAEALAAATAITREYARAEALTGLAPGLPAGLLADALATASAITDDMYRARALTALAPHLPADLLAQALATADTIADRYRADVLTALAPHLPPALLADALATARAITGDMYRAKALTALAPHLPPALLAQALAAATGTSDHMRTWAVKGLVPHLPPDLLAQAVAVSTAVADDASCAAALTALAPHLPPGQQPGVLRQALAAATAITREYARAQALTGLAPHLPPGQQPGVLRQALAAATAITHEPSRAQALAKLVPHLLPGQLADALAAATAITGEYARAQALTGLAPHLPPGQLADALAAATAITGEYARAQALTGLAPHLPPGQLADALAAATAITGEYARAQALTGLAPHLPPGQQPDVLAQALAAATAITGEYARAQALTGLAPHLPPGQRRGVILEALSDMEWEYRSDPWLTGKRAQHRTIQVNFAITDDIFRVRVRAKLAHRRPHYHPFDFISQADTADPASDHRVTQAIKTLAPYMPADLLAEALTAAAAITNHRYRAEALAALASHLPAHQQPAVLAQALAGVTAITDFMDERYRAEILAELAPHLPADRLAEALAAATASPIYSAEPLIALAPRLPPELLGEALNAALSSGDDVLNAVLSRALAVLMPDNRVALLGLIRTAIDRYDRPTCLEVIATSASAIAQLGGMLATQGCVEAITDVHRWWP